MTFYDIGSKILKANSESILAVCEWEINEEGNAELISITNREDTKSFEMVTQIIDGHPVIYKLGAKRTLDSFQAVWLTRRAMPIYGGKS